MSAAAAVIGSGPNGLAAAVTLARAGVPVTVFEAAETPGGGTRTAEVVQPGVWHDVCSAIHPMALASEFFRSFQLERRMEFVVPEVSYAHPLEPGAGPAALAHRSLERTAADLGVDGTAFHSLLAPLVRRIDAVQDFAMGGSMLDPRILVPSTFVPAVALGMRILEQGTAAWSSRFSAPQAPALLSGVLAHGIGRLPSLATAAVGLVLAAHAHARGWPVPVGGSRAIPAALIADLEAHGGQVITGEHIASLSQLRKYGDFDTVLCDTSALGLSRIAGDVLPAAYRRSLERVSYGPGSCKVDFVLDGPVPWSDGRVQESPTVHVGGTREEVARAENDVVRGRHPERPFVLLAQPDAFDPGRNPAGRHAIWSYTHVPNGSNVNVGERVIEQIERFAPGFHDRIVDMRVTTAAEIGSANQNFVGGDISAGAVTMRQLLARPVVSRTPWRTPVPGLYLASGATSPGPGVHGLAGWYAAKDALRRVYGLAAPDLARAAE
ncbi:MAG: phytoene desaturase family protein [Leucobacter sp.]